MLIFLFGLALAGAPDVVLDALTLELDATMAAWKGEDDAPYFLGYRLVESRRTRIGASDGTLDLVPQWRTTRKLDVQARVGSYEVDNTRRLRGDQTRSWWPDFQGDELPIDDDLPALRHGIWRLTERTVNHARETIVRVRTNRQVKLEEEEATLDFSREDPVVDLQPHAQLDLDLAEWGPLLTELSLRLSAEPMVYHHDLALMAEAQTEYLVNSEGTRIRQPRVHLRLSVTAGAQADDGMRLSLYRWRDVHGPSGLPDADELRAWIDSLRADLLALRAAPRADPWTGPVLLRGRAAGVFVHEVIGHRVEGHRQKDEDEGQTFKALVGQLVTARTISIVDDPTLSTYAGVDLNGYYRYDQEGVAAQPATIISDGVFQGFLLSRSPLPGLPHSNGHGRAMVGLAPVSRMANTIVSTSDPQSEAELRSLMRRELRRQGLDHGLIVDELAGGFTMTGRVTPNSFNIRAVTAWRIFADGRPDELVRGVDLVGTPLDALQQIMAAGNDPGVFNGYCGAESGSVPNAAVSPSLLIRTLETQKKESAVERPPLLSKPGLPEGST